MKRTKLGLLDEGVKVTGGFFGCGDEGIDAVIALGADGFEFLGELLVGKDTGVLELTKAIVGDEGDITIGDDGFKGTAAFVGFAVLGIGKPTEEIFRAVVKRIFDEMVADTEVGFAFAVDEYRSIAVEDLSHDDVT